MRLSTYLTVLTLSAGLLAFSAGGAAEPTPPQVALKTNVGTIVLELYPDAAPKTVKNFLDYVKNGFYNNTIFYRVIDNFMIQGGGKDKTRNAAIPLEARTALAHGLKNEIGTIAMAREDNPDSASSEFFINVANNEFLNAVLIPDGDPVQFTRNGVTNTMPRADALRLTAGYTPFGRVIDGMEIVNQIKSVQTYAVGMYPNLPRKPVVILSAKVLKTPITPKTIEQQTAPKPAEPPAAPSVPINAEPVAPESTH